jgi:DNA polymerase-3 subunit delta'
MTLEAANSFLKTLEEPPPRNILILNVIEPLDLLPTIVSRCQRIPFNPLSVKLITEWLMNEKNVDEEKALVVAKLSEGSLGRSIYLYESGFLEKRQDYLVRLIQLPELSSEQILKLALEYSGKEKKKDGALSIKDTILFELLSMWKTWYRDLIIMKVNGPADLLINIDFSNKLKKMSKNFIIENLIDSLLVIDRAQRGLMENRNLDLMMENTVLTLKRLATPSK